MALETENGNKNKNPPFTMFPNHILRMLLTQDYFTECEMHIFIAIVLKTISFQGRKFYNISYSYLEKVTKYKKRAIINGIKDMQARNIIENVKTPGAKINCYQINGKISEWIKRDSAFTCTLDSASTCTQENKQIKRDSAFTCTQENKQDKNCLDSASTCTLDSASTCTLDSASTCTLDSASTCTQENKIYINKYINKKSNKKPLIENDDVFINKSKKIVNEDLLNKYFWNMYDFLPHFDFDEFKSELIKDGYIIKKIS